MPIEFPNPKDPITIIVNYIYSPEVYSVGAGEVIKDAHEAHDALSEPFRSNVSNKISSACNFINDTELSEPQTHALRAKINIILYGPANLGLNPLKYQKSEE